MHDLTAFQRDILCILAGLDEPKGVEIKDELDGYYDGEISSGRLYPVLDDLADTGLVEKDRAQGHCLPFDLTQLNQLLSNGADFPVPILTPPHHGECCQRRGVVCDNIDIGVR